MENKPLSPERRREIEAMWEMLAQAQALPLYLCDVRDLLADAAYWRESVKMRRETYRYVEDDDTWGGQEFCFFCEGYMASQSVNHRPDCAWKRAQE